MHVIVIASAGTHRFDTNTMVSTSAGTLRFAETIKSSVGARAGEALRCVHLPLPHLGRSSGILYSGIMIFPAF